MATINFVGFATRVFIVASMVARMELVGACRLRSNLTSLILDAMEEARVDGAQEVLSWVMMAVRVDGA